MIIRKCLVLTATILELLRWGATIDRFMAQYRPDDQVKRDWTGIRRNLAELAKAYKAA